MDDQGTLDREERYHGALRPGLCVLNSANYQKVVWLHDTSAITEREVTIAAANGDRGANRTGLWGKMKHSSSSVRPVVIPLVCVMARPAPYVL